MKKQFLSRITNSVLILMMAALVMVACKKDEEEEPTTTPVEDGTYLVGGATGVTSPGINGLMSIARNETYNPEYNSGTIQENDRPELKEIYMAIQGNAKGGADGFNIKVVSGSTTTTYGPGGDFAEVAAADLDGEEPTSGLWRGSLVETGDKFTVPEDGLYHIAFDSEIMIVVIAKVEWGLIGGATPGGWTDDTPLPLGGFDLNTMTFEIAEVPITENTWKFRYGGGWKIILDADYDHGDGKTGIKVNCNFGTAWDALVPGGDDIANTTYANYKIGMTWTLGSGHAAEFTYVSEAEPLAEYPEEMFIVGNATAYGWATPGDDAEAIMHKCAGGDPLAGVYWKICHLYADSGFKVSDAGWGNYNYGFAEIEEFDADGVTVSDQGGNMTIAANGMYMVVLDLREDMIKLSVKEAEVYGIGDAFGGDWLEDDPNNLFTIDNVAKTLTSPALVADNSIRMYVHHAWIQDWWNAEFNVYSGIIEYRNDGGDQDAVPGTTGQVVTLSFDDNTGTIQ